MRGPGRLLHALIKGVREGSEAGRRDGERAGQVAGSGTPALALVLAGAVALTLAASLWGPSPLSAQEREEILSYDVVVEVMDHNRLVVTEEIAVRALGDQIQRGIYRDFPTSFPRSSGLGRIEAPFEVLEVTRNGSTEPYNLERIGGPGGRGGVRIRIGDADRFLDPGVHRYRIRYESWRWIDFGEDADRLYWNVTGNGWAFPILSASARVVLPQPVGPEGVGMEVFTGPEGATGSAATATWNPQPRTALFETTAPLGPQEGITLRLTFPKGVVQPATAEQEAEWARLDWGGYVAAGGVVALVLALYLVMWIKVGRDPAKDVVVVRYEPPSGYSPAALGFLEERGFHNRQFAAALVSMAVKGDIIIHQQGKEWTLKRVAPPSNTPLAPEEELLLKSLLGTRSSLELKSSEATTVRSALKGFRRHLGQQMEKRYFELNRRWFLAGLAAAALGFALLAWRERYGVAPEAWFLGFWLTGWTVGAGTLAFRVVQLWRQVLGGGGVGRWGEALFTTLFATPFFVAEVVVAGLLLTMVPWSLALAAVALGGITVLFYHLLERPTLRGRGILDALEGFKRFLTAADADRLDRMNPPERTPELFERYLPHAIALGVENRWGEAFTDILTPEVAGTGGSVGVGGSSGALAWYSGAGAGSLSGLASSLGSGFSSSLSSASSPPSSGGGGGGGSSGGGGGGGGGGGW